MMPTDVKKRYLLFAAFSLFLATRSPALSLEGHGAVLPEGSRVSGVFNESGGWLTGTGEKPIKITGEVPAENPALVLKGRAGNKDVSVHFKGVKVNLIAQEGKFYTLQSGGGLKLEGYPDAVFRLNMEGGGERGWANHWVRPNLGFYDERERAAKKARWEKRPGASESEFLLEFRPSGERSVEVWLNGQFLQSFPPGEFPESSGGGYEITLRPGGAVHSLTFQPIASGVLSLPVALNPRVEGKRVYRKTANFQEPLERVPVAGMPEARLSFGAKAKLPASFQSLAGPGETPGIAVAGLGKIPGVVNVDLQSRFWTRQALYNLPEQRMFSVPLATYAWADILCAADGDPERASEFTLRVTRYSGTRGTAMADTRVKVPLSGATPSPSSANAQQVGTVSYGQEGNRKTAALWLIRVPIRNGDIEDLLYRDTGRDPSMGTYRYLDVELLDPLDHTEESVAFPPPLAVPQRQWMPGTSPFSPTSGVTVFGIDLVKSPAAMTVEPNPGCKVFYASDKPEWIAKIDADKAGDYSVRWEMAGIEGKTVAAGKKTIHLDAGAKGSLSIPVTQGNGWYAARFILTGAAGEELIDRRSSFVMLPPDTRKAGYESPFYGWWFGADHRSKIKLEEIGPLLARAGVRRAGAPADMPETQTQAYGFTNSHIGWTASGSGRQAMSGFLDGKKTLKEAIAMQEGYIRHELGLWPAIDRMLVFHEGGDRGAPFPTELWGKPVKAIRETTSNLSPEALLAAQGAPTGREAARQKDYLMWPKRIEYLAALAQMVRQNFPNLKMQYGNNGSSLALMGEIFRRKFPKEWIDTVAVEDLGQTFAPERALVGGLHSAWFLRELARKTGYGNVPVTACTEWIGRMTLKLGLKQQAEWEARDCLLALAYGFDTISTAGINDASDGYYYSIWGNGGLCERYPDLAPKPAYAAYATLTQVLDKAPFRRFVDTGSTVLYAAEFQRGGQWIYALWTPRGERQVAVEFPSGEKRSLIDLYGRAKSVSGTLLQLKADTAPQYLVSKSQIKSIAAGASAFREEGAPKDPMQVISFDNLSEVEIVSRKNQEEESLKHPEKLPQYREGAFEIREVNDPEMGPCIEVELKPNGSLPWEMMHEYVCLNLRHPVKTDAQNAGIWIKGNGSWGIVNINKTLAFGPWMTEGDAPLKWPGSATMNFDGWNFIRYPEKEWATRMSNSVTGVTLSIPRNVLVGTEMAPVKSLKVRIKSILLY